MEISDIKKAVAQDENAVDITIYQKDDQPYTAADGKTPVTIKVVGSESRQYRAAKDSQMKKMMRLRGRKLEPDDIRRNRVELAASAIVGWNGFESSGIPFPFSPENARLLLTQADHILEQVEDGIAGHADFFMESLRNSAKSSDTPSDSGGQ